MGFNVIDQIIVGFLGANAVAAVGLLYASSGVGAGVMVARAFGRKDLGEVSHITAAGQALAGGLGLLTALLLVAFFRSPPAAGGRRPKADRQCRYLLSVVRCVDRPDDLERGHQCSVPVVKCATHPFGHYQRCRGA